MIRFFCPVVPGPLADAPLAYLQAFQDAGRRVRAQAIGVAQLACDRRWWIKADAFTVAVETPFINVVCAPPGLMLGTRMTAASMAQAAPSMQGVLRHALADVGVGAGAKPPPDEVVYHPETALVGLFTVGCPNLAIIPPGFGKLERHELIALGRYDRVLVAQQEHLEILRQIPGCPPHVVHLEPRADLLAGLLDVLCASSTSVTGAP